MADTDPSDLPLEAAPQAGLKELPEGWGVGAEAQAEAHAPAAAVTDEEFITAAGWKQEADGTWRNPRAFHYEEGGRSHLVSDDVKRDAASAAALERLRPKE